MSQENGTALGSGRAHGIHREGSAMRCAPALHDKSRRGRDRGTTRSFLREQDAPRIAARGAAQQWVRVVLLQAQSSGWSAH